MASKEETEPKGPSLAGRFALAIALTVGFYALALGIAGFLIGAPIWAFVTDSVFNVWLAFFMIATGLGILRAILPRRVPFVPDGVRIGPREQPRLHEAVARVASEAGDTPPDELYLTLDANAAVTQTGGPLGSGGKRVLFLGLPLLRVLTVGELRGVIAHEYGHYVGGDTKLGAWIFRTRMAMERTLDHLGRDEASWGQRLVRVPFTLYVKAFLRVTSAISRRQEFAADGLAARIAGRGVHRSALEKIHATAPAYDAYFDQEVLPVLQAGMRPPVAEGFGHFLGHDGVREATERIYAEQLEEDKADPYSSHPSLPQRLSFLDDLPADGRDADTGGPATQLIDDPVELERLMIEALAVDPDNVPALEPVDWDHVPERVYLQSYRELVAEHGAALEGFTLGSPPVTRDALGGVADELRRREPELPEDEAPPLAFNLVSAAIAVALVDHGWALTAPPGAPIACRRGESEIRPFAVAGDLLDGELAPDSWREEAERLGVAGVSLAPDPQTAAAAPA